MVRSRETSTQTIRALVVDDYDPWREFVCANLQRTSQLDIEVVGVASDGPEAIEKAAALHPDLVLLDIGLPTMNGIEVARRIRRALPQSAIVFATENTSQDVMKECFRVGASGYVVKSSAADDLVSAIVAVIRRKPV